HPGRAGRILPRLRPGPPPAPGPGPAPGQPRGAPCGERHREVGGRGAGSRRPLYVRPARASRAAAGPLEVGALRVVVAPGGAHAGGRSTRALRPALRRPTVRADGSVLVHPDGGSYKPLNWMSPPCRLVEQPDRWTVTSKSGETLTISIEEIVSDTSHDLGI